MWSLAVISDWTSHAVSLWSAGRADNAGAAREVDHEAIAIYHQA